MSTITNQTVMTPDEFMQYANQYGANITSTDLENFATFCSNNNINLNGFNLELYKHYFYAHYKGLEYKWYFYVNSSQFVDYGPLPQLQPWPAAVQVVNGVPVNPSGNGGDDTPTFNYKNDDYVSCAVFMDYVKSLSAIDTFSASDAPNWLVNRGYDLTQLKLRDFKHCVFNIYKGMSQCYFYTPSGSFVDFGPLPQIDSFPSDVLKDNNGNPQNPLCVKNSIALNTLTPYVGNSNNVTPNPVPVPNNNGGHQFGTNYKNDTAIGLHEFIMYASQYSTVEDAAIGTFIRYAGVNNINIMHTTLENFKYHFFNKFQGYSKYYFYVNGAFVDYGPLPQLEEYPSNVQVINGIPQNPFASI